jgi:hypothetical protein
MMVIDPCVVVSKTTLMGQGVYHYLWLFCDEFFSSDNAYATRRLAEGQCLCLVGSLLFFECKAVDGEVLICL